jgi:nucleotide-binding universal stress UspA family protein
MTSPQRILVPTDFSECADQAIVHAAFLARQYDAALTLLHVIPVAPAYPMAGVSAADTERADEVGDRLDEVVERHDLDGIAVETAIDRGESIGGTILEHATEQGADLIVVGTHGRRGMRRLLLGSEAEVVVRGAEIPVFAVRQQENPAPPHRFERLLATTDLSAISEVAVRQAADLARRYGARLDLLHAVEQIPTYDLPGIYQSSLPPQDEAVSALEQHARDGLEALAADLGLPEDRIRTILEHGDPASTIVDHAADEGADLVVLASHGRSGLERFLLGSVAEKVIRTAPCPVFVTKTFGRSADN